MSSATRWWWIRHAPVTEMVGKIYGALDVACDVSDLTTFERLAVALPNQALWLRSHLSRTQTTAEAIEAAGLAHPEPLIEVDLGEQDFGDWQGLSWDQMKARDEVRYNQFWENPAENTPPGGESFAALINRVGRVIDRYSQGHQGGDIICVAHGGTIRAAIAHALGVDATQAMAFQIDNLSLTRLDHVEAGLLQGAGSNWRVVHINSQGAGRFE